MKNSKSLTELERRRKQAYKMGGPEKLAKRKKQGVLNARERIDYIADPGSFSESGLLARSNRPEVKDRTPADGKITGFCRIANRPVAIASNDFTVLGASSSVINQKKFHHIKNIATKRGMPLVFIGESSGARMPDRMGALGRAMIGQDPTEYRRLRESPWAAAQLGDCYGSSTWYACMSDFVVMRKGATMAVASSRVTSLAINQPVDKQELGGWKLLTGTSGLVDLATDTDEEALDAITCFLSYLPSHHNEPPPLYEAVQSPKNSSKNLLEMIPEERAKVYDMRKIIVALADESSVFELKSRYGRSVVTALTRFNGRSVGIIANNPLFKGGALDTDACNKATAFIVLCDSFNIPLITLVDVPGFLIGIDGERRGAPGRIINWMNALSLVTVPKISVILRKSYGQAYLNMGGGRNSDEVAVWPTADLGFMDPELGVSVMFGINQDDDPELFSNRVTELTRDSQAWDLAEVFEAQDVVRPDETREWLIARLDIHRQSLTNGIGKHHLKAWPTSLV